MGILYNVTLTPAVNDISVTSGNADGWIYAVAMPVDQNAARPAEQVAPRTPDHASGMRRSAKASKRRLR